MKHNTFCPISNLNAQPFLKWAGGKRQLIGQIKQFLPVQIAQGKINQYIEPMIGGGAIFLWLAQTYEFERLVVGDLNHELIVAYSTIKYDVENLIDLLWDIQTQYLDLSTEARKEYFYQIRNEFNQNFNWFPLEKGVVVNLNQYREQWLNRTAQLIFLNRTCFNGLYRVNSQGKFNVPPGKYKKPTICNAENIRAVAKILAQTDIYWGDFSDCKQFVDNQTFVYFDPPYKPISSTANFTSYSKASFDDTEQLRLKNFYQSLDSLGAKLLLSNSDPQNTNNSDNFFQTAYSEYSIKKVEAKRNINSKTQNRGQINEILIANY